MKNKIGYLYGLLFIVCSVIVFLVLLKANNPNKDIIGTWEEVAWKYEKMPNKLTAVLNKENKKDITEKLMIHKAENWKFLSDGTIILSDEHGDKKILKWTLKGRGHILKLTEENINNEYYNLYHVGKNKMVLHFRTDLQAKGIVKLTFKRKEEGYAEKI